MSMRAKITRGCAFCLALVLLGLLGGCGGADRTDGPVTLWVVTEMTPVDGMNYQAEEIVRRFEEAHENVTVTLEILPTEEQARQIRLKQLRSMIPTGKGPDVYLLPVGNTLLLTEPEPYTYTPVEALFPDVNLAMYNGVFSDIHAYYDADEKLGKEALNTTIMDAGVIGGARYVLPLRYNLPLVYTDPQLWEDWGLTQDTFDAGIGALMEAGLAQASPELFAYGLALPDDLSLLPQVFDYENGQLLLTREELADYMRLYQSWRTWTAQNPNLWTPRDLKEKLLSYEIFQNIPGTSALDPSVLWDETRAERYYTSAKWYIQLKKYWSQDGFPLYSGSLKDVMPAVSIAQLGGYEMTVLPLRGMDGSLTAEVTYYGAVGSGCAQPGLAYEFLRMFLAEEFQWDGCRPRIAKGPSSDLDKDPQRKGLVEDSWPVRTVGSVEPLWENFQYQYLYVGVDVLRPDTATFRSNKLQSWSLTDADIPALSFEIDEVRFPIVQEGNESFADVLSRLNDEEGNPTDVEIEVLADQILTELWWHLAEG